MSSEEIEAATRQRDKFPLDMALFSRASTSTLVMVGSGTGAVLALAAASFVTLWRWQPHGEERR